MSVRRFLRSEEGERGWRATQGAAWRLVLLAVLGGLLLALQIRLRGETDLRTQIAGQLVAFALFVPAAVLCWRGLRAGLLGLVLVLAFAGGFRAAVFEPAMTPPLSTDLHRYAWDARVQATGINPYRFAPADAELAYLRDDEVYPGINLKPWRTVYPPGAQASFLAAREVFGDELGSTTRLFLLAEGAAVGLLVLVLARMPSRPPLERVALYAWHPLAVSEIACNGHVDALAVLAGAGLVAAWQTRRFTLAGAAAAFGFLVKLGPLLLVPALARRGGWRLTLAASALAVAAYVPYASVGTDVFGDLRAYVELQRFGSGPWWALEPYLGEQGATVLLAAALALLIAVVALREHESVEQVARSALLVLGGLLLAVSYVQPWHAIWLLPFFAVAIAPGWLWLTGTIPLLYVYGLDGQLPGWVRLAVYGPLALWVLWRLLAVRSRRVRALPNLPQPTRIAAVIPALNEAEALPGVLAEFPSGTVGEVIVVDGGSTDGTVAAAEAAGARVVVERRRGYGRACAAGAAAAGADVIVFLDADGSDDPRVLPELLRPVLAGEAALALGARARREPGALKPHQRLGNRLIALLVRAVYGVRVHDVPPMRAVRRDALELLGLREMTYGWPTEMLVKAARAGLPIAEVDVPSRLRRGGESKIAGRALPSAKAGLRMLAVVARHA
jgi:hypothetical protein